MHQTWRINLFRRWPSSLLPIGSQVTSVMMSPSSKQHLLWAKTDTSSTDISSVQLPVFEFPSENNRSGSPKALACIPPNVYCLQNCKVFLRWEGGGGGRNKYEKENHRVVFQSHCLSRCSVCLRVSSTVLLLSAHRSQKMFCPTQSLISHSDLSCLSQESGRVEERASSVQRSASLRTTCACAAERRNKEERRYVIIHLKKQDSVDDPADRDFSCKTMLIDCCRHRQDGF